MKLVRFVLPNLNNKEKRIGFFEENVLYDITSLFPKNVDFLTYLLEKSQKQGFAISEVLREILRDIDKNVLPNYIFSDLDVPPNAKSPYLIIPFDPPEVWGAGVTYKRSCEARERETQSKNIYDKVYEAKRPEIFFKATSNRLVGPNDWVGLRSGLHPSN